MLLLFQFPVSTWVFFFTESYKRDGRLLHSEDEALRRTKNRAPYSGCFGLHRVHKNSLPKLIMLSHNIICIYINKK